MGRIFFDWTPGQMLLGLAIVGMLIFGVTKGGKGGKGGSSGGSSGGTA